MAEPGLSLRPPNALGAAFVILVVAAATIGGAWIFQDLGYAPCELCLKERFLAAGFVGLTLVFAASAVFGAYHAGVEWGFWPGPTDCTGPLEKAGSVNDFFQQLQTVQVVRCDAVAIRILGLSLAGWNAVISAALCVVAILGIRVSK
jgi:disulfide bond formation protein DsbB